MFYAPLVFGELPAASDAHATTAATDNDTDADAYAPSTRRRTRSRPSPKGVATCRREPLITARPHPSLHAAAASIHARDAPVAPVFVATHTHTHTANATRTNDPETRLCPLPDEDASRRVPAAVQGASGHPERGAAVVRADQLWRDSDDAGVGASFNATMFLATLNKQPGAVILCETEPFVVLTPVHEDWRDFSGRCSNQLCQQVDPHLRVPATVSAASPFEPTDPAPHLEAPHPEEPMTAFSPSQFAAFVSALKSHQPYQALFAQKHMYKTVAYLACLGGLSVRTYYDHPAILDRLDKLHVYAWTDPAAPLLAAWRQCCMVTIHESDWPAAGVPHIVISGALPNAPWDVEATLVPEQDERHLTVPVQLATKQEDEEAEAPAEEPGAQERQGGAVFSVPWLESDPESHLTRMPFPLPWFSSAEDGGYLGAEALVSSVPWSESDAESDETRTPSPPFWGTSSFVFSLPGMAERSSARLEALLEEDEDEDAEDASARAVPSVREARFRNLYLEDDDEDFAPPPPSRTCIRIFSRYNLTLPAINEAPEPAYRPFIKRRWTSPASCYIDELDADSGDDQPHYMSEEQPDETDADADADPSEDEYGHGYGAHDIPRPSCDIFFNGAEEDSPAPAPQPELSRGKGKAAIPAGKIDWFDLPEDDLGPVDLDWATPRVGT
ncbi:hypothetical protein GGX14DRAFT_412990 [Mycena pura]|uniref:Uncharacterized protein n=1 Tax=Mycena pura TaxID=153505 RepID=A0AAD6YST7_9AGAR|nr:hypothetical protein GGX14DRAFT_412990 [Mycena pura]